MRILLLTHEGHVAGSTMSTAYLARGLASRGHEVHVACRPGTLLESLLSGTAVRVHGLAFAGRFDRSTMRALRDIVKTHAIELVNPQGSYDRYCMAFAQIIYRLPVACVHTRRQMPLSAGGRLQAAFYTKMTRKMVAVSEGVKGALVKRHIPAGHIVVIHNGTPREKYDRVDAAVSTRLRERYEIRDGEFVVGCVSRRKKQEQLLQALALLEDPVRVLFVGIEADAQLRELTDRVAGKHVVTFCGTVDPAEALNCYPLFSVMVLPSTMEGLSQSLLEAMALGVPVVSTAAGGTPELIRDGENGLLFDDRDVPRLAACISQVRHDRPATARMVERARVSALEEFSIERTVERYEELFLSLCGKGGRC